MFRMFKVNGTNWTSWRSNILINNITAQSRSKLVLFIVWQCKSNRKATGFLKHIFCKCRHLVNKSLCFQIWSSSVSFQLGIPWDRMMTGTDDSPNAKFKAGECGEISRFRMINQDKRNAENVLISLAGEWMMLSYIDTFLSPRRWVSKCHHSWSDRWHYSLKTECLRGRSDGAWITK